MAPGRGHRASLGPTPESLTTLGTVTLRLAFLLAIWGTAASIIAERHRDETLLVSAERTPGALAVALGAALFAFYAGVIRQDFDLAIVATYATRAMPVPWSLGAVARSPVGVV